MDDLYTEANRQLTICNSCRYCEGYCAVFPALERRTLLEAGDITHLADLCHDCRACFTACMYAPPHEFALNPPAVLSEVRRRTYASYLPRLPGLSRLRRPAGDSGAASGSEVAGRSGAPGDGAGAAGGSGVTGTPGPADLARLARLARFNWLRGRGGAVAVVLVAAAGVAAAALLARGHGAPGSPYRVIAYPALLVLAGVPCLWSLAVIVVAAARYWRDTCGSFRVLRDVRALAAAARNAATLRYLRGGGAECSYPRDDPSPARRRLHACVAYGFLACVASTVTAAIEQDLAGQPPPYPVLSAPVLLGLAGGIGLLAGCAGLIVLKERADPVPSDPGMTSRDYGLLTALAVLAATGLLALLLRGTAAYPPVLAVHLVTVVASFAVAPYTKFTHFVFRVLALVQDSAETMAGRRET